MISDPATYPAEMPVSAESSASAISWAAIFGGAIAAAASSLVLILLGSGLGFAYLSPWPGAGVSAATHIMGPIHGLAFLFYMWMLLQTVSGGGWSRSDTTRLVVAALVPFGAFVNERVLARRQAALGGCG